MDDEKPRRDGKLIRITDDQWDAIAKMADKERRNVTQQTGLLIDEAIAARSAPVSDR